MKQIFLLVLFSLFIIGFAGAVSFEDSSDKVYYFYGQGCGHCANVEASGILEKLSSSGIVIEKYEVYQNPANAQKYNEMLKQLNVNPSGMGVPLAIIQCKGNLSYLSGDTPIINNLENYVTSCTQTSQGDKTNTVLAVIFAALADGIVNPCALGVLAFLLIILTSIGSKKRIIKVVFFYILTIYLVYFFSGLGLFAAIQSLKITSLIFKLSAIALIIAGLINIKDFFWYGKGLSLAIPESKKPILERYAHKATIPAAIILGILVALFELPCTGFFYISVLGMLADSMTRYQAIPLLLLYNLLFVLPLIVISAIVIKGLPPEKVQSWSQTQKKTFKLIMGAAMIILGILMLIPGVF